MTVSDSDSDTAKTPPKTTHKKQRRIQAFRDEYTRDYPYLFAGKKPNCAYCKFCDKEFSVGRGGADDCRRHCESVKHTDNEKKEKEKNKCQKISGFFVQAPSSQSTAEKKNGDSSIRAEVMLVDLVTELNLPLSSLDTFNKALPKMFPDSKIAQNVQCGRSKGTAILKEISAKTSTAIADKLKQQPFTISTDGSTDAGDSKLFPLVVRTYDPDTLIVRSEVLAVPKIEGSATG